MKATIGVILAIWLTLLGGFCWGTNFFYPIDPSGPYTPNTDIISDASGIPGVNPITGTGNSVRANFPIINSPIITDPSIDKIHLNTLIPGRIIYANDPSTNLSSGTNTDTELNATFEKVRDSSENWTSTFQLTSKYTSKYSTFNLALAATDPSATLICDSSISLIADVSVNVSFQAIRSCNIVFNGYNLAINGPFEAGLYQVSSGTGAVTFGRGSIDGLRPEWFGVKGDSSGTGTTGTDNTAAFAKAAMSCASSNVALLLADGIYRVTEASGDYGITTSCSIKGNTPTTSIIYNSGTGHGLYISAAPYYSTWENFAVKGNASSQDGITLFGATGNIAFSQFRNVHSYNNGRHGLYSNNSYGNTYERCQFYSNGGLGVFLDTTAGQAAHNGETFIGCSVMANGGTAAGTTYNDDKGGVKITGAAAVKFVGGTYGENNAWAFIISNQASFSTRSISIDGIEAEANGSNASTGGFLAALQIWEYVSVSNSWVSWGGATNGQTHYLYYTTRSGGEDKILNIDPDTNNNFYIESAATGTGINVALNSGTHKYSVPLVSTLFGDIGASGLDSSLQVFLAIDASADFVLSGFISVYTTDASASMAIYPFMIKQNMTVSTGVQIAVGSAMTGFLGSTLPTITKDASNRFHITLAAGNYGTMTIYEQVVSAATFDFGSHYAVINGVISTTQKLFPQRIFRRY